MQIDDIIRNPRCLTIFNEVNEFSSQLLKKYNDSLENEDCQIQEKDIFDLVWGTIELNAAEVCILDSPLLQRLRRIKQLGMANTVYCNADHSRFSHTLGVFEVAKRMAGVVFKKLPDRPSDFDFKEIVQIAALFHDTGHMFFSHVSELYFTYDVTFPRHKEITGMKSYFCNNTSSTASLHEILSVMIVHTDEVKRLFKILSKNNLFLCKISRSENFDFFIEYVSSLIIGVPIDKNIMPYAMILNSAMDADKLDYLFRDSACTKVPIAIDIARVIQKLDVVLSKDIPKSNIWNDALDENRPLYIMAIKNSAQKVFWQLLTARTMMFESVYHHHKIVTSETMFRNFLSYLYQDASYRKMDFSFLLNLTDDIFNEYFDLVLMKDVPEPHKNLKILKTLYENIMYRNLYKRVASISKETLRGNAIAPVKIFIDSVVKNPNSDRYKDFEQRIVFEYHHIRELLKRPKGKDPVIMFIEMKYEEMESMPIEMGEGYFVWSTHLMKQETMESGRKSKQEQYFLITDCIDKEVVFLALEKTLLVFDITVLSPKASVCAKISSGRLNKIRNQLFDQSYYDNCLFLLPNEMFSQLYDTKVYESIVAKYQSFSGVKNCKVTYESLSGFLRQFLKVKATKQEICQILNGVLKILNNALFIDRTHFSRYVNSMLEKLRQEAKGKDFIALLGNQFDSANHLSYYFNDIDIRRDFVFADDISKILMSLSDEDRLIFFDDGAYSGKQVISIFQEYCGVPEKDRIISEHHVIPLEVEQIPVFKKCKIVLSYICFNSESSAFVKAELLKLGFHNIEIRYENDLNKKIFDDNKYGFTQEENSLLRETLMQVGRKILMARCYETTSGKYKENWDEKRISRSLLGYNDAQQMVVFDSNIPTYSLCAFWTRPQDDDTIWKGLFLRTLKD